MTPVWRSQLWRNKWLELVSTSAFLAKVPGTRVTLSPTWVLVEKTFVGITWETEAYTEHLCPQSK